MPVRLTRLFSRENLPSVQSVEFRILAAAGIALLSLTLLVVFALLNARQSLTEAERMSNEAMQQQVAALTIAIRFKEQVQEWKNVLLRGSDPERLQRYWASFQEKESQIKVLSADIVDSIDDPEALAILHQFIREYPEMGEAYRLGYQSFVNSGFDHQAGDRSVAGIDREPTRLIVEASELVNQHSSAMLSDGFRSAKWSLELVIEVLLVGLLVILAWLFYQIRTRVTKPLAGATQAIEKLAQGEIGESIAELHPGEIGRLQSATQRMSQTLMGFAEAQQTLHRQHVEDGLTSNRLPAESMSGIYSELAQLTNDLIDAEQQVTAEVVSIVSHYANGDFSHRMTELPGERAKITQAVEEVRDSLDGIRQEILMLVDAATTGDFGKRGDASNYSHNFRQMVSDLNALMELFQLTVEDLGKVLHALARGDFGQRMNGHYKGMLAGLQQDTDHAMQQIERLFNVDLLNLVSAAGNGDFSARIDNRDYKNSFHAMAEGLNELMAECESGITDTAQMLGSLANGDLSAAMHEGHQGMFADLKRDADATTDQLNALVGSIKEAVANISSTAQEIASSNQNVANRTQVQSRMVQQSIDSINELTLTVKANAEKLRGSLSLVESATASATHSGDAMNEVIKTMASIKSSSSEVVQIISVIDGLAFQTNMLALNAAVEAARAGEQGRGFAVVATEVGSLAKRSAESAQEIKKKIEQAEQEVDKGAALVDGAGAALSELVKNVNDINGVIVSIEKDSTEQRSGIEHVQAQINHVGNVNYENAELVKNGAHSAQDLERQSINLRHAVEAFKAV